MAIFIRRPDAHVHGHEVDWERLRKGVNPVKIFLSHASEDQPDFVRPLAEALSALPDEFKVWYSEYELTLGDRLLAKIDAGLKNCDYGIVVLSPHFFAK